jgi:tRNA(fMet)-specific endonuclease VapC
LPIYECLCSGLEHHIVLPRNLFPVGELGDYLLEKAITIYVQERKAKRNTEDTDIFIAAFCIHNDYILVTDNIKHFQNITDLHTVNWKSSN